MLWMPTITGTLHSEKALVALYKSLIKSYMRIVFLAWSKSSPKLNNSGASFRSKPAVNALPFPVKTTHLNSGHLFKN